MAETTGARDRVLLGARGTIGILMPVPGARGMCWTFVFDRCDRGIAPPPSDLVLANDSFEFDLLIGAELSIFLTLAGNFCRISCDLSGYLI